LIFRVLLEDWGSLLRIVLYSRKDSYPPSRVSGSGVQASCPNPIGSPVIRVYGQAVPLVASRGLLSWDGPYHIDCLDVYSSQVWIAISHFTITSGKLNLQGPEAFQY
jgi:hypothetical protein